MKRFSDYLDDNGFLMQKSQHKRNFIDSNFLNSGMIYQKLVLDHQSYFDGTPILDKAEQFRMRYRHDFGVLRRYYRNFDKLHGANPEETKRYTDPNHVSRDNSMSHIVLLGELGKHDEAREILKNIVKRGFFFQNKITVKGLPKALPDICTPDYLSTIVRSCFNNFQLGLLYPVLLVLDVFFLLRVLVHVIRSYYQPTYTSTVLHLVSALLQFKRTVKTPFSDMATWLFLKRKKPERYEGGVIEACLRRYSRQSYDPPIYQYAQDIEEVLR